MQDVFLRIKGLYVRKGTDDRLVFETQAKLDKIGTSNVLTYDAPDTTLNKGGKTKIYFEDNSVALTRDGIPQPFFFEPQKLFLTDYSASGDVCDMLLYPTSVNTDIRQDSGNIELEYFIIVDGDENFNSISLEYSVLDNNKNNGGY